MIVESITLNGFRNLKKFQTSFCNNKNLIHGRNGAGKTSILESIFLPAFGKSFLSVKKSEVLNDQSQQFLVTLKVQSHYGKHTVSCSYDRKFSIFLDGNKSNLFEINRYLFPVFFSSADYHNYIESKTYKRKLVDRFIFGIDALYIHHLLSYNRALKQKNHILKNKQDIDQLSSWNRIISETAEKMTAAKFQFTERINKEIARQFACGPEVKRERKLELKYHPSFNSDEGKHISSASFFEQLEKMKSLELQFKRSLKGPHLDGFDILLNGKNLKFYSSGEKKINLLMTYIGFIELYRKDKNEYPVFLVDDYDTAIDDENIDFLMKNYPEMQVIATSTSDSRTMRFDRSIHLEKEN